MRITEMMISGLEDGEGDDLGEIGDCEEEKGLEIVPVAAKRAVVGVGARILFYPTLLYNVFRNKVEAEFRWWDEIDQFLLLGAVPFPKDVPRLRQLGVHGVVTLNEPYETLVSSSLYQAYGIDHLVIPTRDYLFAPSLVDIRRAVDFIHGNASIGRTTYVHCKAGRGRSTTIVLCYLVKYKRMTPLAALEYVRSRRPRVLLAPSQWQAVQKFSTQVLEYPASISCCMPYVPAGECPVSSSCCMAYAPAGDAVLVTEADLEGYFTSDVDMNNVSAKSVKITGPRPVIAKLSCLFAALKVASGSPSVPSSRLLQIKAC